MLRWVFGADTKPFQAGLAQMRTQTKAFSANVGGMMAGALGVGAIVAGLKSVFEEMDRVAKLSARFGETTETMQQVGYAADVAGADMETLAKGMTKVTQNAVTAAGGGKQMSSAFAALGIDAASFADMTMDQKLLTLSSALENGGSSAEGLASMMKILGKSAAEMLPFLLQGPEAISKSFSEAPVMADSAVKAIEYFNDSLTLGIATVKSWVGYLIQAIQSVATVFTANVSVLVTASLEGFGLIMDAAMSLGKVLMLVGRGNFKGAINEAKSFADKSVIAFNRVKDSAVSNAKAAKTNIDEIWASAKEPPKGETKTSDAESLEERRKLAEDIAKLEEEARERQLSLAEKILKVQQEIADLANESSYGATEEERLIATKKMLEAQKELEGFQKEQADEKKRAEDKKLKEEDDAAKKIIDLKGQESELDRDQKFEKLDDSGKIKMLEAERDALNQKAKAFAMIDPFTGNVDDEAGAIEARIAAKKKQGEIDALSEEKGEAKLPTIMAEDMRKAGGGGFANMKTIDPAREALGKYDKMIEKLDSIDRKTKSSATDIPSPL